LYTHVLLINYFWRLSISPTFLSFWASAREGEKKKKERSRCASAICCFARTTLTLSLSHVRTKTNRILLTTTQHNCQTHLERLKYLSPTLSLSFGRSLAYCLICSRSAAREEKCALLLGQEPFFLLIEEKCSYVCCRSSSSTRLA
jgi:hypothetical protein